MPLWASFLTDRAPGCTAAAARRAHRLGHSGPPAVLFADRPQTIAFQPWLSKELEPLSVTMPDKPALAVAEPDAGR